MHVDQLKGDLDVPLGSQRFRFSLSRRRKIDRDNVETLFSQPDPVSSFTICDGQRPTGWR
jgi:hypothetical protein